MRLFQILLILTKYIDEETAECSILDNSILLKPDNLELSKDDRRIIEDMGAMWNTELKCWQVFF